MDRRAFFKSTGAALAASSLSLGALQSVSLRAQGIPAGKLDFDTRLTPLIPFLIQ